MVPTFAIAAPYLPAPANSGGRIRIHRLARALSFHGPVDLYARFWPVELRAGDVTGALSVYRRRSLEMNGPFAGLPIVGSRRVREAAPIALRDELRRAHAAAPYTAVVACHSYGGAIALGLRGTTFVLDEHNIESHYARAVAPESRVEAVRLARWERSLWRSAAMVTAVTEADARVIEGVRGGRVEVVPNGVSSSESVFAGALARTSRQMLFVGSMSHPPNVQCAKELAREVLPRVRARFPEARLVLCGRGPTDEVRALASEHVEVTGTVADVSPWLARASVYVNLLRAGAGSSLKVPEAMAAGVPLVTTRAGIRGFALRDRVHCLVAESADEFAHAVMNTWTDAAGADARTEAAREVATALDWDAVGERFAQLVMRAARAMTSP